MVKIFIDPGHGGSDPGARGNGLLEKNITLRLCLALREYLNAYKDISIKMSRTTDKTVSLYDRTNMANNWGADYFLSIHVNAGGGNGFESFIYRGLPSNGKTAQIRNAIHNHVMKVNGLRERGKKQMNLHVLRESRMPACLTENGFIDSKTDSAKMLQQSWINTVAKAHAGGIAEAFHLKRRSANSDGKGNFRIKYAIPGYYTSLDALAQKKPKTTVKKGEYFIYKRSNGMINVTKVNGAPGSWINPADLAGNMKVGSKVRINQSATHYATGEKIPNWVKDSTYTVQQVKTNRILLKEIYSWLKKEDIY